METGGSHSYSWLGLAGDSTRSRKDGMPIASFPGGQITGATVRHMVTEAAAQAEAVLALHERFRTGVMLTCMDLSLEAEAFGAEVQFGDDEVPTVVGQRIRDLTEIHRLPIPPVGAARTGMALRVVGELVRRKPGVDVLAGVTGPFSIASRLLGVSEALLLTLEEPAQVRTLVDRCAIFLEGYIKALRDAGAVGVFMAEPTAGLMSPAAVAEFCTPAVAGLVASVRGDRFAVLLHNCAARPAHLPALLAAGARGLHFGAPMDLAEALAAADPVTWVFGNLDPARLFVAGTPDTVRTAATECRDRFGDDPRFVLSSGCDLPRATPLGNLEAFFEAARS